MSIETLSGILGQYALTSIFLMFPVLLIGVHLHWLLMPKSFVQRFLKSPHFTPTEVAVFEVYPGKLAFGVIVSGIVCFPNRNGPKRNMADIRDHLPGWYQNYLRLFNYIVIFSWFPTVLASLVVAYMSSAV